MLTLVYLQQGNVKKSKKLMTIVNIDEENLHILKDESFYESFRKNVPYDDYVRGTGPRTLSLQNTVLGKPQGLRTPPHTYTHFKDIASRGSAHDCSRIINPKEILTLLKSTAKSPKVWNMFKVVWRRSGVFIVNFEEIPQNILLFPLLNLNKCSLRSQKFEYYAFCAA